MTTCYNIDMSSLYGEYIMERMGSQMIETIVGFLSYKFTDAETCLILDSYTKPGSRRQGEIKALVAQVTELALKKGCSQLVCTVVPSSNGSTASLAAALSLGFQVTGAAADLIVLRKGLKL